jgi:hypothetical protein
MPQVGDRQEERPGRQTCDSSWRCVGWATYVDAAAVRDPAAANDGGYGCSSGRGTVDLVRDQETLLTDDYPSSWKFGTRTGSLLSLKMILHESNASHHK